MGPTAGQTEKTSKKNRNMVQCIYILMELTSRNMILKVYAQDEDYDYTQISVDRKKNQNLVQCIFI